MSKKEREKYRITIPDVINRIDELSEGEIASSDWFPVPSCSPVTHFIEAITKRKQYELVYTSHVEQELTFTLIGQRTGWSR